MGRSCRNGGHQSRPQNICLNAYLESALDWLNCLCRLVTGGRSELSGMSMCSNHEQTHIDNPNALSVGCSFATDLGLIVRRESAADTCLGFKNRVRPYFLSKHHCCAAAFHKQLGTRDWLADDKIPDLGAEDRELGLLVYMKSPAIFCWRFLAP